MSKLEQEISSGNKDPPQGRVGPLFLRIRGEYISKLGKYMKGYSVALLFNSGDCFWVTTGFATCRYSVVSQLDITHNFLV